MLLKQLCDVVLDEFDVLSDDIRLVVSNPFGIILSRFVGVERDENVAVLHRQQNVAQDLAVHRQASNVSSVSYHAKHLFKREVDGGARQR